MSKINKHNYEAYLLDYSEGNLSKSEKQELDLFLEAHPEFKAELQSFELLELPAEEKSDPVLKAKLKREETSDLSRLDYLLIASVEGELNDSEEKELTELMEADSSLLDELNIYQKTKLPKVEVAFDYKADLKQKGGILIHWRTYAVAVASAAAVIWMFFNINFAEPKYQSKQLNLKTAKTGEEVIKFNYVLASEVKGKTKKGKENVRSKKVVKSNLNRFAELPKQTEVDLNSPKAEKQELEKEELAESTEERDRPKTDLEVETDQLAELSPKVEEKSAKSSPIENDEVSIQEFAKQKLKKEVLKNKTFSEALAEEIGAITNDKVSFETQKDKDGETERFALNIGKFSISRK